MKKLKELINQHLEDFPEFEDVFAQIDIMQSVNATNNTKIDCSKTIIESIAKNTLKHLNKSLKIQHIEKKGFKKVTQETLELISKRAEDFELSFIEELIELIKELADKTEELEQSFVDELIKFIKELAGKTKGIEQSFVDGLMKPIENLRGIRNTRGDVSHGHIAPIAYVSNEFTQMIDSYAEATALYILKVFYKLDHELPEIYDKNGEFNAFLDGQYKYPSTNVSYSKALFDHDSVCYHESLCNYNSNKEESGRTTKQAVRENRNLQKRLTTTNVCVRGKYIMSKQPEQILEDNLVKQLEGLEYEVVSIENEKALLANLKKQLEKHNEKEFSDKEFKKILNHLNKGSVFDRAKTLRDKMQLTKDNGDKTYIEFLQQEQWCQNQFQVTQQVTVEGSYKNRYDVTLLINGLPLVHIELKRRGLELKEAFNQINRYQRHSFWASQGLFQFVQIFVISNGVNTKYYANNRYQSFKQTFYWADKENKHIKELEVFTKHFLEPCHLSKMITKYIVLNEAQKIPMVLRPYQYYATEAILERVKTNRKNGYIWHTTGSGKTLTSFKASQILMKLPKVHKVIFVVDRKDLDYQTTKEFNSFSKGSIDGTDNTKALVKQLSGDTPLIVTTIQKLNTAISKQRFLSKMEKLKNERVIFIFDECHRSQFGETHKRIKAFFTKAQMFGFTGTPIFADNAVKNELGKRTTKELFEDCLHKYVITDAIRDENVLKFSVEYIGRYKNKEGSNSDIDIEVEDIDKKELLESAQRLEKITDYIIANHNRKTHTKDFTALFCVSSIETLVKYYEIFKARKNEGKHSLKIATIFSYATNEDDKDANGFIPDDLNTENACINSHSRDKLEEFIADYNKMFGTKFTTKDSQSFYNYYNDIAKKVKSREIDILLVVNMFLTGFDSPYLNTLYVDKNLKYHGLIQAFSRTNRVLNEQKSQGNILCFRNLKQETDDAIALFSNKDAKDIILIEPYEEYVRQFKEAFEHLLKIAPTVKSVDDLPSEEEELEFIKAFRELMRLLNVLKSFAEFSWENLSMSEQTFEDYKSKYLDLYDKVKNNRQTEKVSILDDVDFELELIHRDEINVAYILKLLAKLKEATKDEQPQLRKIITDLLNNEVELRSKRELIEKFIEESLYQIQDAGTIPDEFEKFWTKEKQEAFQKLCEEEKLFPEKLDEVVAHYHFTGKKPLRDEIVNALREKPKVLERKPVTERIIQKILSLIDTFDNMMG